MPWRPLPPGSKADLAEARRNLRKTEFLVDENVDVAVVGWLRENRWNAVHVANVGLSGRDDEEVFSYAYREDRMLLTHDPDFLDNRRFPPHRNPGVIVLPSAKINAIAFGTALGRMATIVGNSRDLWRQSKIRILDHEHWVVSTFERDVGQIVTNRFRFRRPRGIDMWDT